MYNVTLQSTSTGLTIIAPAISNLLSTYELLPLRNLNGQAARRGLEIHFPRYQFQHEPDQLAFQRTLLTLLQQIPLKVEIKPLANEWPYFYEGSIGCIGVLKDWLVRALAASLAAGQSELLLERIQECARTARPLFTLVLARTVRQMLWGQCRSEIEGGPGDVKKSLTSPWFSHVSWASLKGFIVAHPDRRSPAALLRLDSA